MQVYFLCTGNSCRSQMAEGFARVLAPDWTVASAGLERHGLNPQAVAVMAEVGIDISQQVSKQIDADFLAGSDLVVTLCGDARDRCPVVPGVKLHWPLPDPAGQELAVFRQVRDDIKTLVAALVAAHN